jgi:hypothetical protein
MGTLLMALGFEAKVVSLFLMLIFGMIEYL